MKCAWPSVKEAPPRPGLSFAFAGAGVPYANGGLAGSRAALVGLRCHSPAELHKLKERWSHCAHPETEKGEGRRQGKCLKTSLITRSAVQKCMNFAHRRSGKKKEIMIIIKAEQEGLEFIHSPRFSRKQWMLHVGSVRTCEHSGAGREGSGCSLPRDSWLLDTGQGDAVGLIRHGIHGSFRPRVDEGVHGTVLAPSHVPQRKLHNPRSPQRGCPQVEQQDHWRHLGVPRGFGTLGNPEGLEQERLRQAPAPAAEARKCRLPGSSGCCGGGRGSCSRDVYRGCEACASLSRGKGSSGTTRG